MAADPVVRPAREGRTTQRAGSPLLGLLRRRSLLHAAEIAARRVLRGPAPRVIAGVVAVAALPATLATVAWLVVERALHPPRFVEPYRLEDYPFAAVAETVRFPSLDGTPLAGWFVPCGTALAPAVVLLHEYRASRAQMLPHAAYLYAAGYHVLLFDLRHRGESGGDAVTIGAREPLDVRGAVRYLLGRPEVDPRRVAVQGSSLGASAGLLAMAEEPHIAAAVVESAFTDLEGTVRRAFRHFSGLPPIPLATLTLRIYERRTGVRVAAVRPIDAVVRIGARPLFFIEALGDARVPANSARRLYEAAAGPKQLWHVPRAIHGECYDVGPEEFARRVLAFYAEHLGSLERVVATS